MKVLLTAAVLFLGIAAWYGTSTPAAYACSAGDDFNPVAESDLIVVGTIVGWRPVETPSDEIYGGKTGTSPFQTVAVTVQIDEVLKGTASHRTEFLDLSSRLKDPLPNGNQWGGSGGSCAAFGADPTGRYVIMGLKREDDGSLRSGGIFKRFFLGDRDQLSGETYDCVRASLARYGLTTLPSVGHGPTPTAAGSDYLVLVLASILSLAGAWLLLWSRTFWQSYASRRDQ
jgi:hypothetical protein